MARERDIVGAMRMAKVERIIDEFFIRSSWVAMVFFLCLFLSERSLYHYRIEKEELEGRIAKLREERSLLELERERYRKEVKNRDDPSWIAGKLVDELGVVPEGYQKVLFR